MSNEQVQHSHLCDVLFYLPANVITPHEGLMKIGKKEEEKSGWSRTVRAREGQPGQLQWQGNGQVKRTFRAGFENGYRQFFSCFVAALPQNSCQHRPDS